MEELGVLQHNMANSSPVVVREPDLRQHLERPGREPRQRAVAEGAGDHRRRQDDRASWRGKTTRSARRSSTASGRRRRSARSATPCRSSIGQGDGWVRGYEAKTGKKLWEFDLNPKDSVWPKTRNEVISTPVIYENVVYIANGQDPEHGEGVGHLYAIDPTKRGDITQDRPDLALRQDPPLDLDRRDLQRHPVLFGLQRLPARARRQDRQAVLEARHVRRDLGIADGHRRQGLPRRRGRRRRGARPPTRR